MIAIGRRKLLVGAGLAALVAACGKSGGSVATDASPDDMVIGASDAPVTLIEYGSSMCAHCREFHDHSWDTLKREYIDAGKVRFIFREALAPVSPDGSGTIESITLAEYQIARCNNPTAEQYFNRLSVFFEQQPAVFQAGTMTNVRSKLVEIGAGAGLGQDQVMGCIADTTGAERIRRLSEAFTRDGTAAGIPPAQMGTPMFFLDGQHLETAQMMTPDGLRSVLDAAIAAKQ